MKRIVGIELSHKFAPIEVREKLALNQEQTTKALKTLKVVYPEIFIISTCNRLSLYAFGDNYLDLEEYLSQFGNYSQYLSVLPDTQIAVQNLFSTAAGLESQAIGEHQIIGQIRDALDLAREEKTIGPVLDQLIRGAIHCGKRSRVETNIGKYSASLATVGFELINKHGYDLQKSNILIIGTGNMANLMQTVLDRSGFNKLFIASHDTDRAKKMAELWKGEAVSIHDVHEYIAKADIVIGGTQGEINLLSEQEIENSRCSRAQFAQYVNSPKLLIDFGLPRNFNPKLKEFKNISLYDLDDIKKMTFQGLLKRYEEIPQVKTIIKEEEKNFIEWFYQRKTSPVIEAYLKHLEDVKSDELKWLMPKLGDVSDDQMKLIEKFAHRMLRKISKKPLKEFNNIAQNLHHQENPINTVKKVFDLKDVDIFVPKKRIIIGTRGSKLALTQTSMVIEELRKKEPQYEYITKIIKTSGDGGNIDALGAFTTAIQVALLEEKVDIAVHSFKDLPIEQVKGLKIAAVTQREDVRDVIISKSGRRLAELPDGAVIGTGSLRRKIQLKNHYPNLEIKFIQGNVDSRIKKMIDGDYDAVILAAAGLKRLGMFGEITEVLDETDMLPAVGQGALALEVRKEDKEVKELVSTINHSATKYATFAERKFLQALGGGCNFPIASYATVNKEDIIIRGLYATENGEYTTVGEVEGETKKYKKLAVKLAAELETKLQNIKSNRLRNTVDDNAKS